MNIYDELEKLNISYKEIEHKAVFTVEEALYLKEQIDGIGCKNLFLTDKKDNYYLYVLRDDKRADLKLLTGFLNVSRLTFASDEDLEKILGLTKGSVTPLGIINDKENKVLIILDRELKGNNVLVHPNVNTKTISLNYDDLIEFIKYENHKFIEY